MDGNQLLSEMRGPETFKKLYALGYIAGVADTGNGVTHCSPSTVTLGQVQDMTEQFLVGNPAIRDLPADILIVRMLNSHWPCPKKPAQGRGT